MRRYGFTAILAVILVSCGGAAAASPQPSSSPPQPSSAVAQAAAPPASVTSNQRALVLGGGGPLGRAWELGMLKGLKDAGIDLTQADLVVGTSAGSILGTQLRAGKALEALYSATLGIASQQPSPAGSQRFDAEYARQTVEPLTSLTSAADLTPALRMEVGKRALAATRAISQDAQLKATGAAWADIHEWPRPVLKIAAGDASDGSIRFFTRAQDASIEQAVTASTANPQSGKEPFTIGGRPYMDGAVGGSNVDGAAGYGAIVALLPPALLRPEVARQQVEAMRSRGEHVVGLEPDANTLAAMGSNRFDVGRSNAVAEAAMRQASTVTEQVRQLWSESRANDPLTVYRQYIDVWSRHDVAATMALYADDATFTGPFNCTSGCTGKDAFRPVIERQANVLHETGKILDAQASGSSVTAHLEVRQDQYRNFGIERTIFIETMTIRDGMIASLRRQLDMTDPETVRFASAQAAAKPAASAK